MLLLAVDPSRRTASTFHRNFGVIRIERQLEGVMAHFASMAATLARQQPTSSAAVAEATPQPQRPPIKEFTAAQRGQRSQCGLISYGPCRSRRPVSEDPHRLADANLRLSEHPITTSTRAAALQPHRVQPPPRFNTRLIQC
ncbi:hypothetical protein GN244_ATG12157 [Phytophthora infestans]|uniref:Uncharacterized protein n=1 Tax=Phytophthora infestans TaxID=4787 RepID=A0A833SNF5_PHYIN|nr:hypothetical protein GN244_ATG12157 [Phytophthora infestans]KAF4141737.1 hypothetical protein GN958_ATG09067 [Phytophthora infestans]